MLPSEGRQRENLQTEFLGVRTSIYRQVRTISFFADVYKKFKLFLKKYLKNKVKYGIIFRLREKRIILGWSAAMLARTPDVFRRSQKWI